MIGSITLIVFRNFALGNQWPIGEIFLKDWPIYIGGILGLGAIYSSFQMNGLVVTLGIFIVSVAGAFGTLQIAKSWAGMVSFAMLIVGYALLFFS
jgi:hypothetical protein